MDSFSHNRFKSEFAPCGYLVGTDVWRRFGLSEAARAQEPNSGVMRARAARILAARLNMGRDFSIPGTLPARAGEILAMGLLTEALRYVAEHYCLGVNPGVVAKALSRLDKEPADRAISAFAAFFSPLSVLRGELDVEQYLAGAVQDVPNRETAVLESMLLQVTTENPALAAYREVHDTAELKKNAPLEWYIGRLEAWFASQPPHPGTGLTLMDMLRAPARACPESIEAQLEYVLGRWQAFLPEELLAEARTAQGMIREETTMRGFGPGESRPLSFGAAGGEAGGFYAEPEAFTPDKDWMPNVVLIAKSVYVWLYQLSKKHGRNISRLDEIPDVELDQLAQWGFNAVWLIGLWERSCASRDIKRRMGNPEAEASAYSLYDYAIAGDLGGEAAYHNLADRAWKRGIRLASDMVPNHMGIFSRWMVEHPDRFMQLREPPFPGYRFTGPNLSPDPRVGIYLEDGYWNHSDAAVVFKRVDQWTGDTRYIYHGNDGTSMPWNDTAQLNFMIPETREAVIQTILHVARKSPIIRFDAAMTLAKRHYQRLWFPKPGDGGAIPSRAEQGMTREEFDRWFPEEFWRQVVDRVAAEAPNTLLLAEAFWLMEGYFVRTLGMHRVYNSAFMNMLKMEENVKFRQTVKNVLEFSPEVLQRFVNFMNNPDEDTAVAQFGNGDKYFGVAVLLSTMPGLPMFGHGQIEGLTEKYGMEYRRAYYDESPDYDLVRRHEREIFPLTRLRHIFSGARNFAFYDFVTPDGWVDENVFAYSNRDGNDRALIVYNNVHTMTRGVLHTSTAINLGSAEEKRLHRVRLADALGINTGSRWYVIFRDCRTDLEHLHHSASLAEYGFHVELRGYEYLALVEWRQVEDTDASWGRLHGMLAGRGVPSVEEAYLEMHLAPLLDPFRELISSAAFSLLHAEKYPAKNWALLRGGMGKFLEAVRMRIGGEYPVASVLEQALLELKAVRGLPDTITALDADPGTKDWLSAALGVGGGGETGVWRTLFAAAMLRPLGLMAAPPEYKRAVPPVECDGGEDGGLVPAGVRTTGGFDAEAASAAWMREWFLVRQLARVFEEGDGGRGRALMDAQLARIVLAHARHLRALNTGVWGPAVHALFGDADVRAFLLVHTFANRRWFNRERLELLLSGIAAGHVAAQAASGGVSGVGADGMRDDAAILLETAEDAGYDFDAFLALLK